MRSTVESLEGNKVKVVVEVEEDEFEKDLDAAFRRLAREVRLPGFRPGKAPRKVLEARIGQSYARDEAFREALPTYYSEAVKEHAVDVIAPPEIDITVGREAGPVTFDAVVEVRPAITVESYEGLEIEVSPPAVSDEEVGNAIDRMRASFGELETVDRPGASGDRAVIDIETYYDGELVAGFTADDYVYEIGSGATGVSEVDERLIGASAGDVIEITADHPEDDEDEPLDITITVQEIQEMVLPEVTDAWAADNSEFETLAELRQDVGQRMLNMRLSSAWAQRRNGIVEALVGLVSDDLVPSAMIDAEIESRAQDLALRLQAQGSDLAQYLERSGQSQEELVAGLRHEAVTGSKLDLALRAIAQTEQLEVTEDEIEDELVKVADQVQRTADEVRADFAEGGRLPTLRSNLLKSKAFDWVMDRAKLVDIDGQPVRPEALELPSEDETGEDDQ